MKYYLDDLLRGLLKNLVVYGTGRQADIDDLANINEILKSQRSKEYPLRQLLKEFVRSDSFLDR